MLKSVFTYVIMLFCQVSIALAGEVDSLKQLLRENIADTSKVIALNRLALLHYNIDGNLTLQYAKKAAELALKINYEHGITESYKMQGVGYWILGKPDSAIYAYSEGLSRAEETHNKKSIATFYNNLSLVHSDIGNYHTALSLLFDGLKYIDDDRLKANFLQNIGSTYIDLKNYEDALTYTESSIKLFRDIGDESGTAVCLNNLGEIYIAKDQFDTAKSNLNEAQRMFSNQGNERGISITTRNIALIHYKQGQYNQSINQYNQARRLFKEQSNQPELASTLTQLGKIHMAIGNFVEARKNLLEALKIVKEAGLKDRESIVLLNLSAYYDQVGREGLSLSYLQDHMALKDSLYNLDKNRQIVELTAMYDNEKKAKELLQLREDRKNTKAELERQQANQQMLMVILGLSLLALLALGGLVFYKVTTAGNLKKLNVLLQNKNYEVEAKAQELNEAYEEIKSINTNLEQIVASRTEKLDRSNAELAEFLYRASHDLRGPLMTLKGLSYVGLKDGKQSFENIMLKIGETSDMMNSTLNNLLNINVVRKSDLTMLPINIHRMVESVAQNCEERICKFGIDIHTEIDDSVVFESDPELILIILHNLVCNAIQYYDPTKEKAYVKVKMANIQDKVILAVEDNGIGIAEDQLEKIFKMFYRGDVRSHGNGLGLYTVKVAVENMGGKLDVTSEVGKGTEVRMVF